MRGRTLWSKLLSICLRHSRIVGDVVRSSKHVSSASVNLFVVIECVLDLLNIHRLVVLVQQLYLVLSQKQNDLVLNVLLLECIKNQIPFVSSKLVSDSFSYFATDLFHYFHVRSLSHLC